MQEATWNATTASSGSTAKGAVACRQSSSGEDTSEGCGSEEGSAGCSGRKSSSGECISSRQGSSSGCSGREGGRGEGSSEGSKLGSINKEHQFRDAGDPLRKSILLEGTEKGELAKEADELVQRTVLLELTVCTASLACMKDRQGWAVEMKEVEGVELDLRGMEWFMENPVGMLAMQDYMIEFKKTVETDCGEKADRLSTVHGAIFT